MNGTGWVRAYSFNLLVVGVPRAEIPLLEYEVVRYVCPTFSFGGRACQSKNLAMQL